MKPIYSTNIITRERGFSAFPETLWTRLKCEIISSIGETEAVDAQFLINSFGNGANGSPQGVGPQTGFTGGYGQNYPTGHKYLLSTASVATDNPAAAPYNNYVVIKVKVLWRFVPKCIVTSGRQPTSYISAVAVIYQNDVNYSAVTQQTWVEQPNTKVLIIPNPSPVGNGTEQGIPNATTPPRWNIQVVDIPKLVGLTKREYIANPAYWGTSNTMMANNNRVVINFSFAGDNINYFTGSLETLFVYTVKYFNRNIMSSGINS